MLPFDPQLNFASILMFRFFSTLSNNIFSIGLMLNFIKNIEMRTYFGDFAFFEVEFASAIEWTVLRAQISVHKTFWYFRKL